MVGEPILQVAGLGFTVLLMSLQPHLCAGASSLSHGLHQRAITVTSTRAMAIVEWRIV